MVQVVPPHYRRQDNSLITRLVFSLLSLATQYLLYLSLVLIGYKLNPIFFLLSLLYLSCLYSLLLRSFPKTLERCIVKPLGQLVSVSSMTHITYTPDLSTS